MNNYLAPCEPSARAATIIRRTYARPTEGGGFESWEDIVGRVISHQRWLWQRALGDKPLDIMQEDELEELREVLLTRAGSVSGRTLWLGGTEVAKRREASMFNCAFTKIETVHDVVDAFLRAGSEPELGGRVFNVASGTGTALRHAFEMIVDQAAHTTGQRVAIMSCPWPKDANLIEQRNFVASVENFKLASGWRPRVDLREGVSLLITELSRGHDGAAT